MTDYNKTTDVECESCGVAYVVHHDGALINFCSVCGEIVYPDDQDSIYLDDTEFDIH